MIGSIVPGNMESYRLLNYLTPADKDCKKEGDMEKFENNNNMYTRINVYMHSHCFPERNFLCSERKKECVLLFDMF